MDDTRVCLYLELYMRIKARLRNDRVTKRKIKSGSLFDCIFILFYIRSLLMLSAHSSTYFIKDIYFLKTL